MNKELAYKEFKDILWCARKAGIYNALFPGFGTLLGIVREHDFIEHDHDMDMCILSERITKEQEEDYYNYLKLKKLFRKRERKQYRTDTNRFTWFSLRREQIEIGVKCCNWFFFKHNNYYWHSKGKKWAFGIKFKQTKKMFSQGDYIARAKGIPAKLFEELIDCPVRFYDLKFKIPKKYGTILDLWYPNWKIPYKGGSSDISADLIIQKWKDKKSWITIKK